MFQYDFALGIDVSKNSLDCCIGHHKDGRFKVVCTKSFKNMHTGFNSLQSWLQTKIGSSGKLHIVVEATGVYHEDLAYYLHENLNYPISILLPIKAKYYFKSHNIKTKTDSVDSKVLSMYGLERKSENWKPISPMLRTLKQLCREYHTNKKLLNQLKNKLHAKEHSYKPNKMVVRLLKKKIINITSVCNLLESEIKSIVLEDDFLTDKIEKITSIPGVGVLTAITTVAETNGFELMTNSRQLCSYVGLDVVHKVSGTMKGKSKISKRGNSYIRGALYMPALCASKHNRELSKLYQRINENRQCKKIGLIAVVRKLLVLIYTLWKKDQKYIENYESRVKTSGYHEERSSSSSVELKIQNS